MHLVAGLPADAFGLGQCLSLGLLVRLQESSYTTDMEGEDAEAVRDEVVHLAGDAHAFLDHGRLRLEPCLLGEEADALTFERRCGGLRPQATAGQPGAAEEDPREEGVVEVEPLLGRHAGDGRGHCCRGPPTGPA